MRTQVIFTWSPLLEKMDELSTLVSTELGKNLDEARGEIVKIIEAVELACAAPMLMQGDSLMNVSTGHDTVLLPRAARRVRRDRALQLPGDDPVRLDGAAVHHHGNTFVLKLPAWCR